MRPSNPASAAMRKTAQFHIRSFPQSGSPAELAQSSAIRFCPEQIVHFRIGDDRQTFRPYGIALVEAARQPAHQLRLMEDAMLVYRLTRAPERRVFYIDVGQLPPFKAEGFMERMKDMLRKKKTFSARGGAQGASPVEERSPNFSVFLSKKPNFSAIKNSPRSLQKGSLAMQQ
jgi:hypothetical protein